MLFIQYSKGDNKKSDFNTVANSVLYGTEAFVPVESGNGIFSGGRAAGLDEFWSEASKSSKFSGTFLATYRDDNGIESCLAVMILNQKINGPAIMLSKKFGRPLVLISAPSALLSMA